MKTIIFIFLYLIFLLSDASSNELKWVDEQIQSIKPNRQGISNKDIDKLKNPFILLKKQDIKITNKTTKRITRTKKVKYIYKQKTYKKTKKDTSFILEAIMNKTALINKKWYKVGDKINNYIIKEIAPTQVVLIKGSKHIILSTNTQNLTLKFKN